MDDGNKAEYVNLRAQWALQVCGVPARLHATVHASPAAPSPPGTSRRLSGGSSQGCVSAELSSLRRGLADLVPPALLEPFEPLELDRLLCGQPEVDVSEVRTGLLSSFLSFLSLFWFLFIFSSLFSLLCSVVLSPFLPLAHSPPPTLPLPMLQFPDGASQGPSLARSATQGVGIVASVLFLRNVYLSLSISHTLTLPSLQVRAFCEFQGGLGPDSAVCLWLWEYWRAQPPERRGELLAFATGAARVPLDGFDPPFTIVDAGPGSEGGAPGGAAAAREALALPRAHTCFNQLVLPRATSYDALARGLEVALDSGSGFFLS